MKKHDEMVKIIDISAWIALLTIFAVIAGALTWGFFGTMLLREDTTGVMVKSGRIINIYATDDFRLLDLNIDSSEYVQMEQVIARAEQIDLVNEINQIIARNAPLAEISVKRAKLIEESQITTPEAGRVVDVFVHSGDFVRRGDKIATISKEAPDGRAMECYLFIPAGQIKNVRKNMDVNIYPANVNNKLYGNMTGIVTTISEFPVTENHLFNLLGSMELAREFLKDGACYEVYINLETSEDTVTGYAWTTSFGPPNRFGNITLCDASIIMDKVRPIDFFFGR
jgi:multidrug resistance efflux pump